MKKISITNAALKLSKEKINSIQQLRLTTGGAGGTGINSCSCCDNASVEAIAVGGTGINSCSCCDNASVEAFNIGVLGTFEEPQGILLRPELNIGVLEFGI